MKAMRTNRIKHLEEFPIAKGITLDWVSLGMYERIVSLYMQAIWCNKQCGLFAKCNYVTICLPVLLWADNKKKERKEEFWCNKIYDRISFLHLHCTCTIVHPLKLKANQVWAMHSFTIQIRVNVDIAVMIILCWWYKFWMHEKSHTFSLYLMLFFSPNIQKKKTKQLLNIRLICKQTHINIRTHILSYYIYLHPFIVTQINAQMQLYEQITLVLLYKIQWIN